MHLGRDSLVSEQAYPLGRVGQACGSCMSGARRFTGRHRVLLLDPAALFTLASALLPRLRSPCVRAAPSLPKEKAASEP